MGKVQKEPKKIYIWVDVEIDYLCFTANTAGSTVKLRKNGNPTTVTLETSTDGQTWSDYTIDTVITLTNIGDKVYWRNKSETNTLFSSSAGDYYYFVMTGSIAGSGDATSLINKNFTDTIPTFGFLNLFNSCTVLTTPPSLSVTEVGSYGCYYMFYGCSGLTSAPSLPATTINSNCYENMFYGCSSLEELPSLPATTLADYCYRYMFRSCTKLGLYTSQTGQYQTPYRIPAEGTGMGGYNSLYEMFASAGLVSTPSINTTYYAKGTVV